jgi:DNA repair protein RadA/Sms
MAGALPECGQWNSLLEQTQSSRSKRPEIKGESYSLPIKSIDPSSGTRILSGNGELDRVLGGGFMRGSAILLGGEPGIGKSTLLLQLCASIESAGRLLYISGEESPPRFAERADRLGALKEGLEVLCTSELDKIISAMNAVRPILVVIDSIQTVYSPDAGIVPGSANQVKYCTLELTEWAKNHDAIIVFVAHVTKDGFIAGPKAAEHSGTRFSPSSRHEGELRRPARHQKTDTVPPTRTGAVSNGPEGLEESPIPREFSWCAGPENCPRGAAVAMVHEVPNSLGGTSGLTVPAKAGLTRVYSDRVDASRVARIAAVLEKQTGIKLSDQDLYINVAGGLRLTDRA